MLQPKRVKHRKVQKGKIKKIATRGYRLAFGSFGIKVLEPTRITARQIEAVRVAITRVMQRRGQLWLRVFPDKPITKKPAEVRMGKGKGSPEYYVAVVPPGKIIFEGDGVAYATAVKAVRSAGKKLGIKTKLIIRNGYKQEQENSIKL